MITDFRKVLHIWCADGSVCVAYGLLGNEWLKLGSIRYTQ